MGGWRRAHSEPPSRAKAAEWVTFFMPRHRSSWPRSSPPAPTARSRLIASVRKVTVAASGCALVRARLRSGLLIDLYAAVVYRRKASTCASESAAVRASGALQKSASVSPRRPASRTPLGKRRGDEPARSCMT